MRIPDSSNRLAIVGATGSGKTQAALWHLSLRDIDKRPWIIYNFKTDKSIDGIPHIRELSLNDLPLKPGVYVTHPSPGQEDEVSDHLWAIWDKEGMGVLVDEGYMVGANNSGFRAILTQGRSKEIPMIVGAQRPVWQDRFVFSESEFFQIFRLNHKKDRKSVEEFVPADLSYRLPDYHSYYYDVGEDKVTILKPVPTLDKIYATFDARLKRVKRTV